MHAVFLDLQTFNTKILLNTIEAQTCSLTCYPTTSTNDVLSRCQDAEIIITNKVILTAELLKQLPKLKLICIAATGSNNVDITAASSLGIAVTNVSGYANNSVTQYVFSQILDYYSQTTQHHKNTEQGLWQTSTTFCYHGNGITELARKTLGIIGYGSLGQSVEKLAQAFGMKVLIAERKEINELSELRTGRTLFSDVLKHSDIITLHCPQTKDTEHLVNKGFLVQMKKGAMLINSARGALIDNKALLRALKSNTIAYAVLDVLEQEPPPKDHLLLNAINAPLNNDKSDSAKLDNLKITAHIAWASFEAQQQLIELIAENISTFKQGGIINRLDQ